MSGRVVGSGWGVSGRAVGSELRGPDPVVGSEVGWPDRVVGSEVGWPDREVGSESAGPVRSAEGGPPRGSGVRRSTASEVSGRPVASARPDTADGPGSAGSVGLAGEVGLGRGARSVGEPHPATDPGCAEPDGSTAGRYGWAAVNTVSALRAVSSARMVSVGEVRRGPGIGRPEVRVGGAAGASGTASSAPGQWALPQPDAGRGGSTACLIPAVRCVSAVCRI